jgi:hypothetical protein
VKTKLLILASLILVSSVAAEVTVTQQGRVLKDGVDIGAVPDAMANKVVSPSEVQTALVTMLANLEADKAKAETEATEAKAAKEAVIEKIKAADAKPTAQEKREALKLLADEQKLSDKAKRLAEKAAAKAAIEKEIAEINANP